MRIGALWPDVCPERRRGRPACGGGSERRRASLRTTPRSTMRPMRRGCARGLAAAAVIAAGCGADPATPPDACLAGAERVTTALRAPPGQVRLDDGTPLSTCLRRARSDADLQQVGRVFTAAADGLALQASRSDTAALRLGYLIAAARRGARTSNG